MKQAMRRYRFYVGTDTRSQPMRSSDVYDAIELGLIRDYGGVTIYPAYGGWRDADGTIIRERVYVYEILTETLPAAAVASELAILAKQTSVLWTVETVQGGFSQ